MLIGGGADQLHVDVHGVGNFLHTTFKQMGDPKLLPDFTQIVGRTFVFLGRTTRNNFERRDFRKPREDIVLNSFGKISIRFVVAQIIEWKDSNAFGPNFRSWTSGSCIPLPRSRLTYVL